MKIEKIKEQFRADMRAKGIAVTGMNIEKYQAGFNGYSLDINKFLDAYFKADEYPMIRRLLGASGNVWFCVSGKNITFDASTFRSALHAESEFQKQVIVAMDNELRKEMNEFATAGIKILMGCMYELYRIGGQHE